MDQSIEMHVAQEQLSDVQAECIRRAADDLMKIIEILASMDYQEDSQAGKDISKIVACFRGIEDMLENLQSGTANEDADAINMFHNEQMIKKIDGVLQNLEENMVKAETMLRTKSRVKEDTIRSVLDGPLKELKTLKVIWTFSKNQGNFSKANTLTEEQTKILDFLDVNEIDTCEILEELLQEKVKEREYLEELQKANKILQVQIQNLKQEVDILKKNDDANVAGSQKSRKIDGLGLHVRSIKKKSIAESGTSEDYLSPLAGTASMKQQRIEQWRENVREEMENPKEDSQKSKTSARKSTNSSGRASSKTIGDLAEMVSGMTTFFKANALPDPSTFKGTVGEDFKAFLRMFRAKYGKLAQTDEDLASILEEKFLAGNAKTIFKSLKFGKKMSFDEKIAELEKRLQMTNINAKTKAMEQWESLKIGKHQTFADFCMRLDEIAAKAFDCPIEQLDMLKMAKLSIAVQRNETLSCMLAVRRGEKDIGEQFEHARTSVIQFENDMKRKEKFGRRGPRSNASQKSDDEPKKATCQKCGKEGHYANNCDQKEQKKCSKCGKLGHLKDDCRVKTIKTRRIHVKDQFEGSGRKMTQKFRHVDKFVDIEIDSGSVVSMISLDQFNKLTGNITKPYQIFEPMDAVIVGADGQSLDVIGQVDLRLERCGKFKEECVRFQLIKGKDPIIVMGTNGFDKFGIYVGSKGAQ